MPTRPVEMVLAAPLVEKLLQTRRIAAANGSRWAPTVTDWCRWTATTCRRSSSAQAQGIKVLMQGTDTTYCDVMMNIDQYNCGEQIAEMAIEWLIKTRSNDGG